MLSSYFVYILMYQGQSYMELFKYEQAHKAFERVLEIEPKNAQVYKFFIMLNLAQFYQNSLNIYM